MCLFAEIKNSRYYFHFYSSKLVICQKKSAFQQQSLRLCPCVCDPNKFTQKNRVTKKKRKALPPQKKELQREFIKSQLKSTTLHSNAGKNVNWLCIK